MLTIPGWYPEKCSLFSHHEVLTLPSVVCCGEELTEP